MQTMQTHVGLAVLTLGLAVGACNPVEAEREEPIDEGAVQQGLRAAACGGSSSVSCPAGDYCADVATDSCDPAVSGFTCDGTCKRCRKSYVSRKPAECATLLYECPHGLVQFQDERGCGCACESQCADPGVTCPACEDPNRSYVSHDPHECAVVRYFCAEPTVPFNDACGCGCVSVN
jgi:hypothetical protein